MIDTLRITVQPNNVHWASYRMHFSHTKIWVYFIMGCLLVDICFAKLTFKLGFENPNPSINPRFLIFIISGLALFNLLKNKPFCKRVAPEEDSFQYKPTHYEITKDSLLIHNDTSKSQYSWKAIKEITEDKLSIYIWLDNQIAYFLPKEQLEDPKALYMQLKAWLKAKDQHVLRNTD